MFVYRTSSVVRPLKIYINNSQHTVQYYAADGERFAGLNIRGFSTIEVFTEILSRCLDHKCLSFSTIKERRLYSWKNFCGTIENCEKCKSLAQRIFSHLQSVCFCSWYAKMLPANFKVSGEIRFVVQLSPYCLNLSISFP